MCLLFRPEKRLQLQRSVTGLGSATIAQSQREAIGIGQSLFSRLKLATEALQIVERHTGMLPDIGDIDLVSHIKIGGTGHTDNRIKSKPVPETGAILAIIDQFAGIGKSSLNRIADGTNLLSALVSGPCRKRQL